MVSYDFPLKSKIAVKTTCLVFTSMRLKQSKIPSKRKSPQKRQAIHKIAGVTHG